MDSPEFVHGPSADAEITIFCSECVHSRLVIMAFDVTYDNEREIRALIVRFFDFQEGNPSDSNNGTIQLPTAFTVQMSNLTALQRLAHQLHFEQEHS